MAKRVEYKNLKEIKNACRKVKTSWTEAGEFSFRCLPFLAEQLVEINKSLKVLTSRQKRSPSAYNIFVGEQLKQGKTFKEASENWKKDKGLERPEKLGQVIQKERHPESLEKL